MFTPSSLAKGLLAIKEKIKRQPNFELHCKTVNGRNETFRQDDQFPLVSKRVIFDKDLMVAMEDLLEEVTFSFPPEICEMEKQWKHPLLS